MASWPTEWPAAVRASCAATTSELHWPDSVAEAMVASAEHTRALAESERPREHFAGEADGARWFFETVLVQDEHVVVRQVIADDVGTRRYSWQRLEDAEGGLTDVPLDPAAVQRIEPAEFAAAWQRAQHVP